MSRPPGVERIHVAGCPIDLVDLPQLTNLLCEMVSTGKRCTVLGVYAAFAVEVHKRPVYQEALESMTFVPIDGFWVAWAARALGYRRARAVGIERLVYQLLPQLAARRATVYLLGARERVVQQAASALEAHYTGLQVVGLRDGYFTEADEERILSEINAHQPDLLLIGISTPQSALWMARNQERLQARLVISVGGLFDVLAGCVPSAPDWWKDHGLEWFFRFLHDPKRLWKRYTLGNAHFVALVLADWWERRVPRRSPSPSLHSPPVQPHASSPYDEPPASR